MEVSSAVTATARRVPLFVTAHKTVAMARTRKTATCRALISSSNANLTDAAFSMHGSVTVMRTARMVAMKTQSSVVSYLIIIIGLY
jgi:hypothetical protein